MLNLAKIINMRLKIMKMGHVLEASATHRRIKCQRHKKNLSMLFCEQHAHRLISMLVIRSLHSIIPANAIFWLASVTEQTGLSLTCSNPPNTGFLVTWLK